MSLSQCWEFAKKPKNTGLLTRLKKSRLKKKKFRQNLVATVSFWFSGPLMLWLLLLSSQMPLLHPAGRCLDSEPSERFVLTCLCVTCRLPDCPAQTAFDFFLNSYL